MESKIYPMKSGKQSQKKKVEEFIAEQQKIEYSVKNVT